MTMTHVTQASMSSQKCLQALTRKCVTCVMRHSLKSEIFTVLRETHDEILEIDGHRRLVEREEAQFRYLYARARAGASWGLR